MFGLLSDVVKGIGEVVGATLGVAGSILQLPIDVISETLDITKEMVIEAKEAGCETYQDIRNFFDI